MPTNANAVQYDGSAPLLAEEIPEAVGQALVSEKGHTERLYYQETDLNTIAFANLDGTETIYIFDEPVKYFSENGEIEDKSNILYNAHLENYAYVNKDNDIRTYFPDSLEENSGIKVEYGIVTVEMSPHLENHVATSTSFGQKVENSVYYYGVFGENTAVRYTPTFSGVKEDIILFDKSETSKFSFVLDCNGLEPTVENDIIALRDKESGDIVATVGSIYVYDSYAMEKSEFPHETSNNKYELSQIDEGKYIISLIVDQDFLENEDIVYPVYIDPSITINASGTGSSKTILDTPIYNGSGVTSMSAGGNPTAVVGYVGTLNGVQYGAGRLLMRFPGLMSQSFMSDYQKVITSATLYMKESSGLSSAATISAYMYNGPDWNESSRYSSSIWDGMIGDELSSYSFSYPNRTNGNFDITWAVQIWQSNPTLGSKGIILKNKTSESNLSYYKTLYTAEGSTKPYLSVTYATRTSTTGAFLDWGSNTRNITIKLDGSTTTSTTWKSIITNSCKAWNDSKVNMNFTTTTSGTSKYTLTVGSFADRWLGLTTPIEVSNGTLTSASIKINTRTLGTSTNVRTSTVTHELGHLIWLNDFKEDNRQESLMWHGREREIIYTPQMMDVYHALQKMK